MSMRASARAIAVLIAVCSAPLVQPTPARAQVSLTVSFGVFHDHLAGYGRWVTHERFGTVWVPTVTVVDWQPYRYGHWVYTDFGWTWVSDEPFGWATYHYGRWYRDVRFGWIWVPDTIWGPAWVAWRAGNVDYIGWAPLPPDADVETDVVFEPVVEPAAFVFVRTRYMVEPELVRFVEPPARSEVFIRTTTNVTTYSYSGTVIVNRGVAVERVERSVGRPVPRLTVQATSVLAPTRVERDQVVIYRPVSAPPPLVRSVAGRTAIAAPLHHDRTVTTGQAVPRSVPLAPAASAPPAAATSAAPIKTPSAPPTTTPPGLSPGPPPGPPPVRPAGPPPPANAPAAGSTLTPQRGVVPPAAAAQYQREVEFLSKRHTQELADLEKRQADERKHPPVNLSQTDLAHKQTLELKTLQDRQRRERQQLDAKYGTDRGR
jgi:hypothetical protein